MTTNIQLLRSSIAYKRPSAAPLLDGQAAINLNAAEPGLFWRLTNGQLAKAGPVAITDNGMEPNAAPAGETGNSVGEEWLDAHPALHAPILHIYNGTEFVTANGFTVDKSTGNLTLLRQLEVTKLVAGAAEIDGNMVLAGNLTPAGQNCAFYLGLPTERWDYFYGCNFDVKFDGNVSRHLTIGEDLTVGHDLAVENAVASNLLPDVDSTRHLGRSDRRWIGWLSALNVDGSMQLGTGCEDILTVTAKAAFKCGVDFEVPITIDQIGNTCDDTLTVKSVATFDCRTSFKGDVSFEGKIDFGDEGILEDPVMKGDILIGETCDNSTVVIAGATTLNCDMLPDTDSTVNLGSETKRFANIYTGDLHLKNEKGDWTMVEEEDYLTIRNNKTGKTFRLMMEEV